MATATTPAKTNGPPPAALPDNRKKLMSLLESSKKQIQMALPRHLTAEKMVRMAVTLVNRTPGLQECDPLSIVACVVQASELGLELSGPLGQCYMVPRWNKNIGANEATFQVGYRGLIDLAMRSGKVDSVPLRIVYTNDYFDYEYGTQQFIRHKPSDDGPPPIQDESLPYPDNVRAVYAVIYLKGSDKPDFEVMTTQQIEQHRRRYSPKSYTTTSPWRSAWEEMARKTPCRRLAKRSPVSIEFQKAAILDEYAEAGVGQNVAALMEQHGIQVGAGAALPAPSKADRLADQLVAPQRDTAAAPPSQGVEDQTQAPSEFADSSSGEPGGAALAPEAEHTPSPAPASAAQLDQVKASIRAKGLAPQKVSDMLRRAGFAVVDKLTSEAAEAFLRELDTPGAAKTAASIKEKILAARTRDALAAIRAEIGLRTDLDGPDVDMLTDALDDRDGWIQHQEEAARGRARR